MSTKSVTMHESTGVVDANSYYVIHGSQINRIIEIYLFPDCTEVSDELITELEHLIPVQIHHETVMP